MFLVQLPHASFFCFAGLWGPSTKHDAKSLTGFAIINGTSAPAIEWLDDRMPLVVPPSAWDDWMSGSLTLADARSLLLEVVLPHTHAQPWEAIAISPFRRGRKRKADEEPLALNWWSQTQSRILAVLMEPSCQRKMPVTTEQLLQKIGGPIEDLQRALMELLAHQMIVGTDAKNHSSEGPSGWLLRSTASPATSSLTQGRRRAGPKGTAEL